MPCAEGLGAATDIAESDDSDSSEDLPTSAVVGADVPAPVVTGGHAAVSSSTDDQFPDIDLGRTEDHHSLRIMQKRAMRELERLKVDATVRAVSSAAESSAIVRAGVPSAGAETTPVSSAAAGDKRQRGRPGTSAPAAPKGSKQRRHISLCSSAAKLPAAAEEGGSDSVAGSRDSAIVADIVVDDTDPAVEHAATGMEDDGTGTGIAGDHADEDGTWNA